MAETSKPTDLTARLVTQPSAALPGIPPFVFSAPQGWITERVPGALAVIRVAEAANGFYPNARLTCDVVPKEVDFKRASETTFARLKQTNRDVVPKFERMVAFGENKVYLRGVELPAKDARVFSQLHALFFAPVAEGAKVADFFQFTCTAPSDMIDKVGPNFMELIGSFRFL